MRIKFKLLLFVLCLSSASRAANYFWVGGTGNWSDFAGHWATTSGGSVFHIQVPTPADDVFFDANSFTAAGQTVTADPTVLQCRNMTWAGVTNNPTFNMPIGRTLQVFGSMTLVSNMNVGILGSGVNFEATTPGQTITSAGKFFNNIIFNGAGGEWTLQDNLNVASGIQLNKGTFNTNNKTVKAGTFLASGNGASAVNLGSSFIDLTSGGSWTILQGVAVNAGTSTISIGAGTFQGGNHTYNNVNGTQPFGTLVFNSPADTINAVSLNNDGIFQGNFVFGSLSFTPGHTYRFSPGTVQTILNTINATGSCTTPINISSLAPGSQATIKKTTGTVTVTGVNMKDISATGGAVFTAVSSTDLGNNSGWIFSAGAPRNLFWVGNSGNWNDASHWSLTSGGAGGNCPPAFTDNVSFDANSFTLSGQTVTMLPGTFQCRNMSWTGVVNTPTFDMQLGALLQVFGSMTLVSNMNVGILGSGVNFEATTPGQTITSAGKFFNNIIFNGAGGEWTLQDNLNVASGIQLNKGTFNTNNKTVKAGTFLASGNGASAVNLGSSFIDLTSGGSWTILQGVAVNAGTSTISIGAGTFQGGNHTYNNVNGTQPFGTLVFNSPADTINAVSLNNDGIFQGNFVFGSLSFTPGHTYRFSPGTVQTILNTINATGSCTTPINISSLAPGSQATIKKTSGTVTVTGVNMKDISATGGAVFTAVSSTDLGNNSGWIFSAGAPRNLFWVGNSGNWTDASHWSLTSGGAGGNCPPAFTDNVSFDANSFTLSGQTVTMLPGTFQCRNMSWTGVVNTPTFDMQLGALLQVFGSMTLVSNMNVGILGSGVNFEATTPGQTITSAGKFFNNIIFNGAGGEWTLQDNLNVASGIQLNKGTFTTNNKTIKTTSFSAVSSDPHALNLGNSFIDMTSGGSWTASPNLVLDAGTSTISIGAGTFEGGNLTYYNVNGTQPFGSIVFNSASGTFHTVRLTNDAIFQGNFVFDSLVFSPGHLYRFYPGTVQTITPTGTIVANGNGSFPIVIQSLVAGSPATISKTAGSICLDFVRMADMTATGGAFFNAGLAPTRSFDLGGNTGWVFTGSTNVFYRDADGDGYGDPGVTIQNCSPLPGYIIDGTDCNDNNAAVHPGAIEVCNGIDDDCDGLVDEGVQTTFYRDADGDGYGDAGNTILACSVPQGYVTDNTDCNDNNAAVHPGAAEVCGNGIDDNCNGQIDENCCTGAVYAGADVTLYYGYLPAQCVTKTAVVSNATGPFTYQWTLDRPLLSGETMTGANTQSVTVCLRQNANLCVTVTEVLSGCHYTDCAMIYAQDIRCGTNGNNIKVNICHNGNTICVSENAVPAHLAHGDYLGVCASNSRGIIVAETPAGAGLTVYPNPSRGDFTISVNVPGLDLTNATIQVLSVTGRLVKQVSVNGQNKISMNIREAGVYLVKLSAGKNIITQKLTVLP